jgi:hypothetical protein
MGGKGSGRTKGSKNFVDPFDPDTWPADSKRRLEREMQLKDVLMGSKVVNSPKKLWIRERTAHLEGERIGIGIDNEMLDTIADIQAMHKLGAFRYLPLSVREMFFRTGKYHLPFNVDEAFSGNPKSRPWNTTAIVRMSLEVMRLYLMGLDPYMSRAMRNYLSVDLHKIGMKRMTNSVHRAGEFEKEFDYEDDSEFDFSGLSAEDLEF